MSFRLIQTGKTKFPYLDEGIGDYFTRINHYVKFEILTIPDIKNSKKMNPGEMCRKEGTEMLRYIRNSDFLILLDENGKKMDSGNFADYIRKKSDSGKNMTWMIGGAYGFSDEVKKRADDMISLSALTFSHQMVRLIFLEQVYRAFTIIKGEPYHHR
jgi:23S rRNA (pseudouridine1915-N3)-methyltransferase